MTIPAYRMPTQLSYRNLWQQSFILDWDDDLDYMRESIIWPHPFWSDVEGEELLAYFKQKGWDLPEDWEGPEYASNRDYQMWRDALQDRLANEGTQHYLPMTGWLWPIDLAGLLVPEVAQFILDLYGGSISLVYSLQRGCHCLAMTGAGMDFTDELCRAYCLLGEYPPIYLAESFYLSKMTEEWAWVYRCCLKSLDAGAARLTDSLTRQRNQYDERIRKLLVDMPGHLPFAGVFDYIQENNREDLLEEYRVHLEALGIIKEGQKLPD